MTPDNGTRYALEVNGRLIGPTHQTEAAALAASAEHEGVVGIARMPSQFGAVHVTYL